MDNTAQQVLDRITGKEIETHQYTIGNKIIKWVSKKKEDH